MNNEIREIVLWPDKLNNKIISFPCTHMPELHNVGDTIMSYKFILLLLYVKSFANEITKLLSIISESSA